MTKDISVLLSVQSTGQSRDRTLAFWVHSAPQLFTNDGMRESLGAKSPREKRQGPGSETKEIPISVHCEQFAFCMETGQTLPGRDQISPNVSESFVEITE
jgi:hypothetical protein